MTIKSLVWAFPVAEENLSLVDQWYTEMQTQYMDDVRAYQNQYLQKRYMGWLQTSSAGNFVVEYGEHDTIDAGEMLDHIKHDDSDFIRYMRDWKNRIHNNAFNRFKGIRKLLDVSIDEKVDFELVPIASVYPILPGKMPAVIDWTDQVLRNDIDEMTAYRKRIGSYRWAAWISEFEDCQLFVQFHYLKNGFEGAFNAYQQEECGYAHSVQQFGMECFGLDFTKKEDWPDLRLLMDVVNPDMEEG